LTKDETIALLETPQKIAYVWGWDYRAGLWKQGKLVEIANGYKGKYLRSDATNKKTDHLRHLINFSWVTGKEGISKL
jgi:hypothetical protein